MNNNTAILLAAGFGSRLRHRTRSIPKCMVEVCGVRIIDRMIKNLISIKITRIIVVVGYLKDTLIHYIHRTYPSVKIEFIENKSYHNSSSAYSLGLALNNMDSSNVLLIETDVIIDSIYLYYFYRKFIKKHITSTILSPYSEYLSGTFALITTNKILSWDHESIRNTSYPVKKSYKTVNITYIDQQDFGLVKKEVTSICNLNTNSPLEYAMQNCIGIAHINIKPFIIPNHNWFEIDDEQDLIHAENTLKVS